MATISTRALTCTQNGVSFFVSVMNSQELKKMCFVSRKKEDAKKGFQRLLSEKRAREIANYLDSEKGIIPPALILSAQPTAQLAFDNAQLNLTMENSKGTLLVLDGQHRLYVTVNTPGV
ncbi:MAG: DGQHR domain-containing protein [Oscillospiraceae bacterium]